MILKVPGGTLDALVSGLLLSETCGWHWVRMDHVPHVPWTRWWTTVGCCWLQLKEWGASHRGLLLLSLHRKLYISLVFVLYWMLDHLFILSRIFKCAPECTTSLFCGLGSTFSGRCFMNMGFLPTYCEPFGACATAVRASSKSNYFMVGVGLRQGCPLLWYSS